MKFDLSGYQNPDGSLQAPEEELGFWGTVGDIAMSPVRGIAGAAEGIYDLADWALMDWLPDAEDNFGLGHSKTLVGGLGQGITQFMVGFVPGLGAASWVGRATGVAAKVGKYSRAASIAGKAKTSKAIKFAGNFTKSTAAGAVADFAVFDAQEQRLSNLLQQFPALQNPVTEFLAADENDTEIEGRLKNLMEGGILGGMMEPFVMGLRSLRKARKAKASGGDPDEALRKSWEAEQARKPDADEIVEEPIVREGDEAPIREKEEIVEEPVVREGEEVVDEASEQIAKAQKKLDNYAAKMEKQHGPEWREKLTPGQAKYLKKLEKDADPKVFKDESGIPTGARKPAEGFPFNLDRHSDRVGADKILEAQVRSASPEVQAELANVRKMTNEDVRAHAEEVNEELGALGAGRFSKRELDHLDSTDQLAEVVAKQNVLRNAHQQYVRLADELAEKARTGTAEDEVRFMLVQQRAEAVGVLVKRNQEKIAQALGAQRMQGTDMLPDRDLIPMEVLDGADPKFVDDALAELGGGDMTRGRKKVQDTIAKYQAVRDAQGAGAATKYLQDKAKYSEMLVEYWINAILSGPLTHMVNMTSNTINTLFLPFERALGTAATFQFGRAGKELIGSYIHLASQFQDAMSAASGAFKNWGDDLDKIGVVDTKQGYDRSIRASNLPGLSNTIGGAAVDWIGKALNMPSRFLMAEDAFFKHLNYRAMVREGLFKEGAAAGKKGAELAQHVEEGLQKMIVDGQHYTYKTVRLNAEKRAADEVAKAGIKDPGERQMAKRRLIRRYMDQDWNRHVDPDTGENSRSVLAKQALQYGRDVTYTRALDDPDRSALVKATGKYNKLVNDVPLMRLITPFVRTPTNLLSFYLNRTVGAYADLAKMSYKGSVKYIKAANKDMAEAVAKGGPSKADVLGRFATGNMLMFGAGMAFHAGTITGGGPKDPARRKQLEATGWQPYSFRVGNEWYSYRRFDPFASFFGTIADFNEAMAESDGEDQQIFEAVMGAVVNSAARNVTNKSYLTGMARISNVLSNPDRYGSAYIESTIASMTPFSSLAGQTIGASEHQKEIRGIVDAVRTKYGLTSETDLEFMGITTQVEDRRNLFGDKVEKPSLLAPFPIHYTEIKDDVVMNELQTLGRQNAFSPPSKIFNSMDSTAYTNSKGQTLYDRWLELHGSVRLNGRTLKQAMKKLIQSRKYQNLPLEDFEGIESPRVGELRKLIRRYRAEAKEQALTEFPEAKALNDRNTKIKHYRRAGRDIQSLLDY